MVDLHEQAKIRFMSQAWLSMLPPLDTGNCSITSWRAGRREQCPGSAPPGPDEDKMFTLVLEQLLIRVSILLFMLHFHLLTTCSDWRNPSFSPPPQPPSLWTNLWAHLSVTWFKLRLNNRGGSKRKKKKKDHFNARRLHNVLRSFWLWRHPNETVKQNTKDKLIWDFWHKNRLQSKLTRTKEGTFWRVSKFNKQIGFVLRWL